MIRIGIICPSEIASRRFLPALLKVKDLNFVGVAIANKEEFANATDTVIDAERSKAQGIISSYGGKLFEGYNSLIHSDEIDCIYLPLPPGLHYKWAKQALLAGKHVLVEKPSTTCLSHTQELVKIARKNNLVLHENYMFIFHNQIEEVNEIIRRGEIGDVRLYRIDFGFPQRTINDFRYKKDLGGGALFDCGGYTLKYASLLLGETAQIKYARLSGVEGFEVDMYGSCAMSNAKGEVAQLSFGMDNDYRCSLEVWGSKGIFRTGRIFTAPAGFVPSYSICKNGEITEKKLFADDAFLKSINKFVQLISNKDDRERNYNLILKQAQLINSFADLANSSV